MLLLSSDGSNSVDVRAVAIDRSMSSCGEARWGVGVVLLVAMEGSNGARGSLGGGGGVSAGRVVWVLEGGASE